MSIFSFFFIFLCFSEKSELPYEEASEKIDIINEDIKNENNFEDQNLVGIGDSKESFFILIGFIIFLFISSVLSYYLGKIEIQNVMTMVQKTLNDFIEKELKTQKVNFLQYGIHEFEAFFTTNSPVIYGCIVHVSMALRCDIMHQLKYLILPKNDKISFEFLIKPKEKFSAMIHISKEVPYFSKDFQLVKYQFDNNNNLTNSKKKKGQKQFNDHGYHYLSDIPGYEKALFSYISEFISNNPSIVHIIEMSDANRFKAKEKCGYVTYIEYSTSNMDLIMNYNLLKFNLKLAETFGNTQLPNEIIQNNKIKREHLLEEAKVREEKMKKYVESLQGINGNARVDTHIKPKES